MKQTAVEWLFLQMENLITKAKVTDMDNNDFVISKVKLLQQAKQMEKEQHQETWFESTTQFDNSAEMTYRKEFEQYYNETFKSE
jgi:hypothetical protein